MHEAIPEPAYPTGYKEKEKIKHFIRTLERQNMTNATASVKRMIEQVGPVAATAVFLKNRDVFDFNRPAHRNTVGVAVDSLRRTQKEEVDEYLEYLAQKGQKEHNNDKYYLNQIGMTPYTRQGTRHFRILPGWTTTEY
jgi:hypothetical protein